MTESETPLAASAESSIDNAIEHHFRSLADAIPLVVWTANPNGELDYYNRQWEIYTGFTGEETAGWGWAPVLHPEDLQRCIDKWTRAFTTGEPYEIEYRFKRASDNTYRWHLGRAIPFKDETGKIIKWFGTGTDIDDQIRSKNLINQAYIGIEKIVEQRTAELASANQLLRQQNEDRDIALKSLERDSARLNEIITTQYLLAKAQLNIDAFISLVVERMVLLTPASGVVVELVEGDEMVYKAVTGVAAGHLGLRLNVNSSLSGLCILLKEVLNCADTEKDARVNLELCRKINIRSMVVAPLFHAGIPVGVLKIMGSEPNVFTEGDVQTLQLMAGLIGAAIGHQADYETNRCLLAERTDAVEALEREIAQRILIEDVVRANEMRTRMIIESSYDAFVAIDTNGIITDWNQQAEITFGWTRVEAVGAVLGDLVIPERFRRAHEEGMKKFIKTGVGEVLGRRLELIGLRKTGEEFPVELTIRALHHKGKYEFCAFLRDITDRKDAEQAMFHLAHNDQLTGLPNRSLFNDRIIEAMRRSKRSESLMALMYLDIDHFKTVNDDHGHIIGDELLIEFSRRLCASVRATDTVARMGGDEFTIIAESLKSYVDAENVASKILRNVQLDLRINAIQLNVTTSIGIAFYSGEETDTEQLISNADRALYRAKQAGRNCMKAWEHFKR